METSGPVSPSSAGIEHIKAELIRNLSGPYDLEFEVLKNTKFQRSVVHLDSVGKGAVHKERIEVDFKNQAQKEGRTGVCCVGGW